MKINGFGDVPLGAPRWIVLGVRNTLSEPIRYINVKFDFNNKTQKLVGKIIEEVFHNIESTAQDVFENTLSKNDEISKRLFSILKELNSSSNPLDFSLKDVTFYSHEKVKFIFTFIQNSHDRISINITTDLDLSPLDVNKDTRGDIYYVQTYHDFKFYELRHLKDRFYLNELKQGVLWLEGIMKKKAPRLNEYLKTLEEYERTPPGVISENQLKISVSYFELEGLRIVHSALKNREGLDDKIKHIIKGVAFKYNQDVVNNDKCREFLYELKIAAYFVLSKYNVDLSQRADIIIDGNICVECKKITSEKKLIERIKDAIEQIEVKEGAKNGIVYVDITDAIPKLKGNFFIVNDKDMSRYNLKSPDPELQLESDLRMIFFNEVSSCANLFIQRNLRRIHDTINDSVLVLHVDLPVLHLSPLHERTGIIKISYSISNRIMAKFNYIVEDSLRSLNELYPEART
ncbi:hypothetical protein [Pectobacterium versatile]